MVMYDKRPRKERGRFASAPLEERFWAKVDKDGPIHPILGTKCWLWAGSIRQPHGYGSLWNPGGSSRVHRISWEIHNGEIPDGLVIMHLCDVKLCVNPDHLGTGTVGDNNRDAFEKGINIPQFLKPEIQQKALKNRWERA